MQIGMRTGIVAFLIGNICLLYGPYFPDLHSLLLIFGLFLILTGILYKASQFFVSLAPIILYLSFLGLFFLSGFIYASFYIKYNIPVLDLGQKEGQTLRVKGYIDSLPDKNDKRQRFKFYIVAREKKVENGQLIWDESFNARVRLSWYGTNEPLKIAQNWRLDVRLKKPNGLLNPGSFDYEQWLYQNRILATGYVREGVLLTSAVAIEKMDTSIVSMISELRQTISDLMDSRLSEYPYKGLVKALSIGSRDDIEPEQWQVFMRTGTNHLIAISGLHIGLVSSLVWFFVNTLWKSCSQLNLRIPAYYIASVLALCSAIIYAGLAGFAIPTQRALIMLAVVFVAIMQNRAFSPSYILLLALFLVLLFDPLSPLAAGFWLSFGAVAIILLSISSRLAPELNRKSKLLQLGKLQWSIFIGLLPLMMILFHQFSLSSPLANLFAVPLMTIIIVPMTLLSSLVLFVFEPLGQSLFTILQWPIDILFLVLEKMSAWTDSVYFLPEMTGVVTILIIVACFWLLTPNGWQGRWLGGILLLPAFMLATDKLDDGQVQITMLDVGQGLSMVLRTRNHTLVYDTGDKYSEQFNMADVVILPFLRLKGIRELDMLMVSHSDRDHAGSLYELIAQVPVKKMLAGESAPINVKLSSKPVKNSHHPTSSVESCQQGQQWQWDNVDFRILSPQRPNNNKLSNNQSCVLLITTASGDTILLTGDIEKKVEKQILEEYPKLRVDILQVPHHGSNTSSSTGFLKQLQPDIALFSSGYRNRFKHPAKKVVQRYKKMPIKLYSTSNGAIDIKRNLSNNSLLVKQYRIENRRFWHRAPEKL